MHQCVRKFPTYVIISLTATCILYYRFYPQINTHEIHGESLIFKEFPQNSKAFLVSTPGCQIPKFDPFDPSVRKFFSKVPYQYNCGVKKPVFKVRENGIVSLNKGALLKQYKIRPNQIDCYFHPIVRNLYLRKPDNGYVLGKKHDMIFDLPITNDFIQIYCDFKNRTIIKDILALTPIKKNVEERCKKTLLNVKGDRLNVVIVGIDSISKLNFLRYFNRTYQFLKKKLFAIELHGYTKVADNTYPNLIPFLTGHQRNYYNSKEKHFSFYDDVDIVWKTYAQEGYRTLYSEDAPNIGTFILNRRGFKDPPTDYYSRAFSVALENSPLRHDTHCVKSKLEMEAYFDYLKLFVRTMKERLFFTFTFVARLTHDVLKLAGFADKPSFELLAELDKYNTLNRTLLIFFSDHGIRFGDIRQTYIGKIEERMPFMFLAFPDWFLNKYPSYAANLKINEKRLTTPYDIHATLLHMLDLEKVQFFTRHGQSLLTEISPMRTCAEALISTHWCVCQSYYLVPVNDTNGKRAANAIVQKLNELLKPFSDTCVKLVLQKVVDIRVGKPNEQLVSNRHMDDSKYEFWHYLITLSVIPSEAVFEATVEVRNERFTVLDDISRINLYANQSHCIQDTVIKKYCFCKDLVNPV